MNTEPSSTYFQRIWQRIKRALIEPEEIVATEFFISHENDKNTYKCPNKKPKMDNMAKSLQDSFDQTAFMEVMKKLLTCSVCLEVRKQANQCQNGHLICINCSLCLQQSSSNKEINCPVCRVPLAGCYQRSLLAEQLVCELPTKCRLCSETMSIRQLQQHKTDICPARTTNCQYALFGCSWKGVAKQRKVHESHCSVGLSTVALACETVRLNLKNQLNYYEKRNSQWLNTMNKLRERNNGLKIFMKHLVLTKYHKNSSTKSSFKSTKLEIFRNQFQLKFNIHKDKTSAHVAISYKLKYMSKQSLNVNFFLHSIRHDDETFELDDNLHHHTFSEDEKNTGNYSLHFSGNRLDDLACLLDTLANKDSLYLEIVLMIETNESLDNANSELEASESISQAITNSRTGSNNAGNIVVALISSSALDTPPNEVNEEESEEDVGEEQTAEEEPENDEAQDPEDEAQDPEDEELDENQEAINQDQNLDCDKDERDENPSKEREVEDEEDEDERDLEEQNSEENKESLNEEANLDKETDRN